MGSDATSTWLCSFSKCAVRTKAAAQDSSETARTSLGKDKNRINIYTESKVQMISNSKSVTAQLYSIKKGVVIGFDNQGWIKVEANIKGEQSTTPPMQTSTETTGSTSLSGSVNRSSENQGRNSNRTENSYGSSRGKQSIIVVNSA
eukprot:10819837-Ditylum_brightwellii.AAC.1